MNGNPVLTLQIDYVPIAAVILCMLPAALTIAMIVREAKHRRAGKKHPFDELKRRPAGESLRLKLETLEQQLDDKIMLLMAGPIGLAMAAFAVKLHGLIACVILLAISLIWTLSFKGSLSRLLEKRKAYRLGFDGERYVGEELSRLIALGFEIYHDVPFDKFNVDHVLVGAAGVFAVETKTRSQPVFKSGKKEFPVAFDGKSLRWPWGNSTAEIEQARAIANSLARWLTAATGDGIEVTAVLTVPGWKIERLAPSEGVYVVKPTEIIQVCNTKTVKLAEPTIRRICYRLDEKCRLGIQ